MKRQFFIENMIRMLIYSLLPLIVLTGALLLFLIPAEKRSLENEMETNLSLLKENLNLLLNDSNKVMNMLSVPFYSNSNSLYNILSAEKLDYVDFVILKQSAAQLNAIVNSRDYIDSIYVYIPNNHDRYLTNQAHIFDLKSNPDQNWLDTCQGEQAYRLIRRTAQMDSSVSRDYLTVIQENSKGYTVAVNIVVSYFQRLFTNPYLEEGHAIILSDGKTALFSSDSRLDAQDMVTQLSAMSQKNGLISMGTNLVMYSHSASDGLDFICVTPFSIAYSNIYYLIGVTCTVALLCIIISIAASYNYASKVSKQIYEILDLMESAISHKKLPSIHQHKNDLYSHIITNMIQTFTQNDFLRVSLNEQKFQALSLELSALQYQINPHFLSNTLQMIDFEILKTVKRPVSANEMIQDLSIFLQYSLRQPNEDSTIGQEIEATSHYTSLMSKRYQDQVHIHWDVAPEVYDFPIPKLILQPLIENSIVHGLIPSYRELDITISIHLQEDSLYIRIWDNGCGVEKEKLEELRKSMSEFHGFHEKHIGLQNLFRRMQLRFSADQCQIILDSAPEQGFSVSIRIQSEDFSSPEPLQPSCIT